jgi:acetyl-CoA carboxylase biotin carboxylase subunit
MRHTLEPLMPLPKRVLIANRGEIAVRVIRACHELDIPTVAVYSDADRDALHVRNAGQAVHIGPSPSPESYLVHERILAAAAATGADAIHPGYGFLSENAAFAKAVIDAGLTWIGPPPDAIAAMGSKTVSRQRMQDAGVPVVPGTTTPLQDADEALSVAKDMGYPVMLKASAGGGGKGMRQVDRPEGLPSAFRAAQSEAANAFGDDDVYIEKRVMGARHVEVQVLADAHGTTLHLLERDCSVQRRNQKVVEESPCPVLAPQTRAQMCDVAVKAAEAVGYIGAGTVEFLLDKNGDFFFLEMNTRLQVEHPITEMITGIDLVQAQIRIAGGEPLWFSQEDVVAIGHAIECRIYAEDPSRNWAPSPGQITGYREPGGPWVRVDTGVYPGAGVPLFYDPLIAKLVVWGTDRDEAIRRCRRALIEYRVRGIATNVPFFRSLLEDPDFVAGVYDTGFLSPERIAAWSGDAADESVVGELAGGAGPNELSAVAAIAAAVAAFERDAQTMRPAANDAGSDPWRWSLR